MKLQFLAPVAAVTELEKRDPIKYAMPGNNALVVVLCLGSRLVYMNFLAADSEDYTIAP